jgi:hypothetical protein
MRMTNEQVIKRINEIREILADYREVTSYDHEALDIAISALSKQSASCEQADKKLFGHGYWLMPGEVFISHNALNKVLDTIIKSTNTEQRKIDSILAKTGQNDEAIRTDDYIADDGKMVDQFREDTKMTEDVPDIHVGKTDFQPGDKFILELGQERRMFGEFEIAGTDLYVETRLLEKLTRYDPEVKLDSAQPEIIYCKDCKYAEGVLDAIWCDNDGGYYNPMRHFCSEAERRNDEID